MDRHTALDFLERVSRGLATMFGSSCEVVIHDMDNFSHSIVHIENGHVSGRSVGDPFKVLGTDDLEQLLDGTDLVNCKAVAGGGKRTLKSSTFHLKGDDYHYALGINFDYTNLAYAQAALQELVTAGEDIRQALSEGKRPDSMVEDLFEEALQSVGRPVALLTKADRMQIVEFLDKHGVFSMQKSIPLVSDKLDVSRYTIYNYLKEIRS